MNKKGFKFYQDVLVSVWQRQHFTIEAESKEEAEEMAKQYGNEDVSYDYAVDDSEYLFETADMIHPANNGGNQTIEVFECLSAYPGRLIADNHIENFKPRNDDLLHEAIADIAFNLGWEHHDDMDSREMARNIIRWAKEFEEKHRGTGWSTRGDYLDEIDSFTSDKIAEYFLNKK